MLAALDNAEGALTYGEWVKAGMNAGLKESTAAKAVRFLQENKSVVKKGKRYMPPREEEEAEQLPLDEAAD